MAYDNRSAEMFNSLVSLESSTYKELKWQTIKDLNLAEAFEVLEELSEHQETVIFNLCQDRATIEYRQAIMRDFMMMPQMLEELNEHLMRFGQFRHQVDNELDKASRLYYLIELLKVVEASVLCLEDLYQTLCYYKITSEGLLRLKASVERLMDQKNFKKMKGDMKQIRYIFSGIKSVEVSINMNTGMRPYEAQVTEVNEHKYRYPKAFRKVSDALDRTDEFLGHRIRNYIPVFPVEQLHMDLLEEIEFALREHHETIRLFLESYKKVDSAPFIRLQEEVSFYMASLRMVHFMEEEKLPLCWPHILSLGDRKMSIRDGYNLKLAKELSEEGTCDQLVTNDLEMDDSNRLMILTGSNRGGKTTFTQMVGQIQVLTQLGLPIPASEASISMVDHIMTDFPLLETESVDHGRFGRNCLAFKDAYKGLTAKSLILMNESFSGTSHLESLQVADEVVRALKTKGARVIYNTHLHELGAKTDEYNRAIDNDCVCNSYVVGDITSDQIYKISLAPPRGYSQAMEIARSFGVTYDQLVSGIGEVKS